MSTLPLPPQLGVGYITGRIVHILAADTPYDVDREPEARGAVGSLTLTPKSRSPRVGNAFVLYEAATININEDGFLVNAHNEAVPVAVVSGSYSVTFNLQGGQIQGFDILVEPEHTFEAPLDLGTVAPYVAQPGETTTLMVVPANPVDRGALIWDHSLGKMKWEVMPKFHIGSDEPTDTSVTVWLDTTEI